MAKKKEKPNLPEMSIGDGMKICKECDPLILMSSAPIPGNREARKTPGATQGKDPIHTITERAKEETLAVGKVTGTPDPQHPGMTTDQTGPGDRKDHGGQTIDQNGMKAR